MITSPPRASFVALVALVALTACAPPEPLPPAVPIAPATPTDAAKPALDPTIASVATRAPAKVVVDGDLSEWGSLLPPEPASAPRAPGKPDRNPRDARSHVAVALTGEGAFIAAELGEGAGDVVWVGLGAPVPPLPPVGEYQRGGGVMPFFACRGSLDQPSDTDPQASEACQKLLKERRDAESAHERRFRRVYRIDRGGARFLADDGALVPVKGALVGLRPVAMKGDPHSTARPAGGVTVEAFLPAPALPRMSEAPVDGLQLVARAVPAPALGLLAEEDWIGLALPAPVGFEPLAALREAVFAHERRMVGFPNSMSYQPGEPLRIENITWPPGMVRGSLLTQERPLYTRQMSLGDVEIGLVEAGTTLMAVLHRGKPVEVVQARGELITVHERGGEIHALLYGSDLVEDMGTLYASWTGIAVGRDGSVRHDVVEDPPVLYGWDTPLSFHDAGFGSFGVRGGALAGHDAKPHGLEHRWRWDEAKRKYVVSQRRIPLPRPPRKKKR